MKWQKLGLLFDPPKNVNWMATHAALPFAEGIEGEQYRIYFSGRDSKQRSQIGYFVIEMSRPFDILGIGKRPVINFGSIGAFDDSGVTSSWIVNHEGKKYQYYTGWTQGVTVPFYFYIGLAVSNDGGKNYERISDGPMLERNVIDPFLTASPCILVENGIWRMWYVSCTGWDMKNGAPRHRYHIKYCESADGITWNREGIVCIDYRDDDEYAISRPCVIKEADGIYKMWYSYRGRFYKIGYAESKNGIKWERRDDESGIDLSDCGWDSEMIEYPFVFDYSGNRYMLYNGNGYGKTGIGLAVLVDK
jgi:hypothetical protein